MSKTHLYGSTFACKCSLREIKVCCGIRFSTINSKPRHKNITKNISEVTCKSCLSRYKLRRRK